MKLEFDSLDEVLEFADRVRGQDEVKQPETLSVYLKDQTALARDIEQVHRGNKICAIKLFRAITGEGLKDSKDAIDRVWLP